MTIATARAAEMTRLERSVTHWSELWSRGLTQQMPVEEELRHPLELLSGEDQLLEE